jgi:hypothetical protein
MYSSFHRGLGFSTGSIDPAPSLGVQTVTSEEVPPGIAGVEGPTRANDSDGRFGRQLLAADLDSGLGRQARQWTWATTG